MSLILFDKKSKTTISKQLNYIKSDTGKTKHYTPAAQEWYNSIYSYDSNYMKTRSLNLVSTKEARGQTYLPEYVLLREISSLHVHSMDRVCRRSLSKSASHTYTRDLPFGQAFEAVETGQRQSVYSSAKLKYRQSLKLMC